MPKEIKQQNILTFPITPPYDVIYRNNRIDYPVGPHSHNAVELYFTLSHLPDVLLNDTVSAVLAGTLIIIPPFCVHQLYHEAGKVYERYILSINIQWLDQIFCGKENNFSYLKESTQPLIITPNSSQKEAWTTGLERLLAFPSALSPEALSCFFELLSVLNQMATSRFSTTNKYLTFSAGQEKTNEIIAYIQEHIYENITVSDLAAHFYLNPDYLSRLFKKHAHLSVGHYIALQKTATAQALLREGYTVTQVQEKLAYSSYAYFFKTFQKNTGISPSKYREQYLKQ